MRLLVLLLLLASGCSANYDKPVRFYPDDEDGFAGGVVPGGRSYVVVARRPGPTVEPLGSVIVSPTGSAVLGFAMIDGQLHATADGERIPLQPMPEGAKYVAWAWWNDRPGRTLRGTGDAFDTVFYIPARVVGWVVGDALREAPGQLMSAGVNSLLDRDEDDESDDDRHNRREKKNDGDERRTRDRAEGNRH